LAVNNVHAAKSGQQDYNVLGLGGLIMVILAMYVGTGLNIFGIRRVPGA